MQLLQHVRPKRKPLFKRREDGLYLPSAEKHIEVVQAADPYFDNRFRCNTASGPAPAFEWSTEPDAQWWIDATGLAFGSGDPVNPWDDLINTSDFGGGGNYPTFDPTLANGYPAVAFNGSTSLLPQSVGALGDIIGLEIGPAPYPVNDFCLFFIVQINSVTSTALSRTSQAIWADNNQRLGLHTRIADTGSGDTYRVFTSFFNAGGAFVYNEFDLGAVLPTNWLVVTIRYDSASAAVPYRLFTGVNGTEAAPSNTTSEINTTSGNFTQLGASFTSVYADFSLAQAGSKLNSVFPTDAVNAYSTQYAV